MKKEELKKLRKLYATDKMMKMARDDIPQKHVYGYSNITTDKYKYGIYLRCQVLSGILKVAFFLADNMRLGSNKPSYELFINRESGEFLTWDVVHEKWRNSKVDMLEWPEYTWHSGKYINQEGNNSIKTHLGVDNGGYKGIHDYQINVRNEELKQKHRRETGPWDMVMDQVPELPKDWDRWVDKCGMNQNYIFYEYARKGATKGYCTWCEKIVPISNPKHNSSGKCKCCGNDIQFKSQGKAGCFYTKEETVYLVQRCEMGFVIRQFSARRHYFKGKYKTPEKSYFENRRVVYDNKLYGEAFYYGLYKQTETRWIKTSVASGNYYSYSDKGRVYKRTIPSLAEKELKFTGLPQLISAIDVIDPEIYIETLKRKSYVEQLSKAGLTRIACEVVYEDFRLNIESMRDLAKSLGIDKSRMRRIRENNGGKIFLEWIKYEKLNLKNIDDSIIQYFEQQRIKPDDLKFILNRMSERKVCNYLKKQYNVTNRKPKELLATWYDYLTIANRLKVDTNLELFYKPKDLIKSHDEVVNMCGGEDIAKRAGEIAELFPDIDDICKSIKTKYEFEDKKYRIIVPERIEDVIVEGRVLGHCLDRSDIYFERIQNRESYIVFLRKQEDLEKPYYTLEIEPNGTARQKRTTGDKQNKDFEDAKNFIKKWQKEIQKNITEEDRKLAKESARLRAEEFTELRNTKTKIWHGHLAGQLLVDVLEQDLMELAM